MADEGRTTLGHGLDDLHGVRRRDLFLAFLKVGLCGFGGVAAWAHRVVVEERRWLSDRAYAELLGLGQILPGPNVINMCVMLGDRCCGPSGALAGLAGLMSAPLVILLGLVALYDRYGSLPGVQAMLAGMAAAAAGLVIGTALKMARRLQPSLSLSIVGGLAFLAAGVFRLPLLWVVLLLAPLGVGAAAWGARR